MAGGWARGGGGLGWHGAGAGGSEREASASRWPDQTLGGRERLNCKLPESDQATSTQPPARLSARQALAARPPAGPLHSQAVALYVGRRQHGTAAPACSKTGSVCHQQVWEQAGATAVPGGSLPVCGASTALWVHAHMSRVRCRLVPSRWQRRLVPGPTHGAVPGTWVVGAAAGRAGQARLGPALPSLLLRMRHPALLIAPC